MYCDNCGAEINNGCRYCKRCGAKILDQPEFSIIEENIGRKTVKASELNNRLHSSQKQVNKLIAVLVFSLIITIVFTLIHPSSNYTNAETAYKLAEHNFDLAKTSYDGSEYAIRGYEALTLYSEYYGEAGWFEKKLLDKKYYDDILYLVQTN